MFGVAVSGTEVLLTALYDQYSRNEAAQLNHITAFLTEEETNRITTISLNMTAGVINVM